MNSIKVGELKAMLGEYPEDYEVLYCKTRLNPQVHIIREVRGDDIFREVRLFS